MRKIVPVHYEATVQSKIGAIHLIDDLANKAKTNLSELLRLSVLRRDEGTRKAAGTIYFISPRVAQAVQYARDGTERAERDT